MSCCNRYLHYIVITEYLSSPVHCPPLVLIYCRTNLTGSFFSGIFFTAKYSNSEWEVQCRRYNPPTPHCNITKYLLLLVKLKSSSDRCKRWGGGRIKVWPYYQNVNTFIICKFCVVSDVDIDSIDRFLNLYNFKVYRGT